MMTLPENKKIYFASDFHLGVPDYATSLKREKLIVAWLDKIKDDAHSIYLVGDIFDFWFEYKHAIPKGFIRFQGKLAELRDKGIPIYFFTGNHDMWMFDYLEKELGVKIFHDPVVLNSSAFKFYIGHGDGLGPGDHAYKFLKKIFRNKFCQWLFNWLHPNIGFFIATKWSRKSRITSDEKEEYLGEKEWLLQYAREMESKGRHHDFYIFGHRHLPLDLKVTDQSRYVNLGEWMNFSTYASFDGKDLKLETFQ